MFSRILFTILGAIFFFASAPKGMANEAIREEIRADFFVVCEEVKACDEGLFAAGFEEKEMRTAVAFEEFALLPSLMSAEQTDSSVDGSKESKREQKRTASHKIFISKCRISNSLSAKTAARALAWNLDERDAGQERTAAIRFMHQEALIG